ncbi:MAG: hypothetical protein GXY03_08620 [Solirubrobacterales bacterium]|nr:hypothetical protein [Solirubrobacterales bacterium]
MRRSTTGRGGFRLSLSAATVAVAASLLAVATPVAAAQEPWGFEKVTPGGKGGGGVQNTDFFRIAPDAQSVIYSTTGPFASVPGTAGAAMVTYLAQRGESGWTSRMLTQPFELGSGTSTSGGYFMSVWGVSQNLRWATVGSRSALTPDADPDAYNVYRLDTHTGDLTHLSSPPDKGLATQGYNGWQAGLGLKYLSDDGGTVIWGAQPNEIPGVSTFAFLKWTAGGGTELFAKLPDGTPATDLRRMGNDSVSGANAVRSSIPRRQGAEQRFAFGVANGPVYLQDGDGTRAISRSRLSGSPAVDVRSDLWAVSDYGRFTLFSTYNNGQLTDDAPAGEQRVLYVYDADEDTLAYIGVRGGSNDAVWQMTHNGRSVAFQSTRALTAGAIAGRANIYLWRDGELQLVAVPDADGAASNGALFDRLMSEDGRYLVFTDNSASLAASFGFDNANPACTTPAGANGRCMQVYRFDADAPEGERLACVSCRTDGAQPAGSSGDPANAVGGGTFMSSMSLRLVVDDGTVFFSSADDLVAADSNGQHDAYAWKDGELRLLSRALPGARSRFVDATADGSRVLIATNDRITADDTDNVVDLYLTGPGAGLPLEQPPVAPAGCGGSDCRADGGGAPLAPRLGSFAFSGGGNVAPGGGRVALRVTRPKAVAGRVARLRVRVPGAGRLAVAGRSVKRARRATSKAGVYTLRVRLSPRARRALARRGRVRVAVRVVYRARDGRRAARTVRIAFRKPSTTRGGR